MAISKKGKRRIITLLAGLLVLSVPASVYAAGALGRASKLKSKGAITCVGEENELVIDSSDLVNIANDIDELEVKAKWETIRAIQQLPDAAKKAGLSEVTEEEMSGISFNTLSNAIKQSQSISGTYTETHGTESTFDDTEEPLKGVTEDTLSLGTAAWANGKYIVGNGTANNNAYQRGYTDGYAGTITAEDITNTYHVHTGNPSEQSGCYTKAVYHTHTGNEDSMGGCYTNAYTGEKTYAKHDIYGTGNYDGNNEYSECRRCGEGSYDGYPNPNFFTESCTVTTTLYSLTCGKTTSTIEGYTLGCGKTETSIETTTIMFD